LLPSPETAMMIAMTPSVRTRRVVLVAFDRLQALDLVGPAEVFSMASRLTAGAYSIEVVAARTSEISTSSGLHLRPDRSLAACRGAIDTLIVVGGEGVPDALAEGSIAPWTARAASRSRRVASVCNGAFLLARAGLLDGRRATTHWSGCETLQRRHPEVGVEPDSIFSAQLSAQVAEREPLRDLQEWISDHLDTDLSVPALAERACMSPRNFARAFRREVGVTPAAYVEAARVEAARVALDGTQEPIESIARRCGFGTVETMRRAFHRRLGVGPSSYRERFLTLEAA
jgi:transcriptional regulator GlxA family with amidase domain